LFNQALKNVRLSPIVSISEEVNRLSNQTGKEFILFQRGEMGFPTPKYIVDAMFEAVKQGNTKYPVSGGHIKLKNAIIKKLNDFNNIKEVAPENIVVTHGGQEGLQLVFKLFEGKKVVSFSPIWSVILENYVPFTNLNLVEIAFDNDFSINYQMLEDNLKDASLLYLNTPHNPTGKVFKENEIKNVVSICEKYGVFILSDEAYERITFDDNKHFSPMQLDYDRIISVFTFSKTYAMTGWRLGYIVTRDKEIGRMLRLGEYTQTAGVPTFTQFAGAEAIINKEKEEETLKEFIQEFNIRRKRLYEGLNSIKGIKMPIKPEGAFYIFPDFSEFIPANLSVEESKLFIHKKLLDAGVATVYGSCFGKYFQNFLRFSYSTTDLKQIEEGLVRIKEALNISE
jgi:aspartate/methionine/tyrosine aminotransferase